MSKMTASRSLSVMLAVVVCAVAIVLKATALAEEVSSESTQAASQTTEAPSKVEPLRELFSGKVVLLQDALKRRDIKVADEMKLQAVLETKSGELIPIAADWRGRAFFQDKKLRDRPVEIVGYRQSGVPYLQALIVYFFNDKGERQEFDYWCDICAIPMYEIKDCECCQGPSRHRYRPAELPAYLFQQEKSGQKTPTGNASAKDSPSEKKPAP
ncbi:MAG: hypothetical protein HQ518_29800 [Rhodopirellula sp.]|nr:hypothetical protein [Rhodopirellula sp.]